MGGLDAIDVEVVYALPARQHVISVLVAAGSSVEQAVRKSGIMTECPEIDLGRIKFGIFGRLVGPAFVVRAGDRIELYRPLIADPKAVRRNYATRDRASMK